MTSPYYKKYPQKVITRKGLCERAGKKRIIYKRLCDVAANGTVQAEDWPDELIACENGGTSRRHNEKERPLCAWPPQKMLNEESEILFKCATTHWPFGNPLMVTSIYRFHINYMKLGGVETELWRNRVAERGDSPLFQTPSNLMSLSLSWRR